jgi:peptidoglycan/LPS O-acetylase OafA/YrhL
MPFYQSWSLGIEEKFYLVWAALGFVVLAGRPARVWVTGLIALGLAAMPLVGPVGRYLFPYYPILMGCLAALVLHSPVGFRRGIQLARPWAAVAVTVTFVALHLAAARADAVDYVYPIAVTALLVSVVGRKDGVTKLLQARGLVFIGTITYGIYLVHILALNAAEIIFPPGSGRLWVSILALLAAIAIAVAMAYLLARTIEWPLRDIGRRLSRGAPVQVRHRAQRDGTTHTVDQPAGLAATTGYRAS